MKRPLGDALAARTLVEVLITAAAGALILGAILTSGVALQRSYMAVESYSTAGGDQLRVLDYVALDCRRAMSATVNGLTGTTPQIAQGSWVNTGGTTSTDVNGVITITGGSGQWVPSGTGQTSLLLSLPPYYDAANNYVPLNPTLNNGAITYGTGSVLVIYYQNGNNFNRRVIIQDAAGTTVKDRTIPIATNVSTFTVTAQDLTSSLSCAITFAPKFTFLPTAGAITGTTVYCNTFLRNAGARN
jgi:hypothetical protein